MTCEDSIRAAREKHDVPSGTLGTEIRPTPSKAFHYAPEDEPGMSFRRSRAAPACQTWQKRELLFSKNGPREPENHFAHQSRRLVV